VRGDDTLDMTYLAGCLILVGSSLLARRLNFRQTARMALAWVAIFAVGFGFFVFRDDFMIMVRQVRARIDPETGTVRGGALAIPMADDGHFWVRARVDGTDVRFLIDSGATTTALSPEIVRAAGIALDEGGFGQAIGTANGVVVARRLRIGTLRVGPIERRDLAAVTAPQFGDMNVLGMNFLSTLSSWGVEGRTLMLRP